MDVAEIFLASVWKPWRQVTAVRQVQTHDSVPWVQQRRVHLKVRRRTRQGLHVHSPLVWVQMKRLQRSLLAQTLRHIDPFVPSVISRPGYPSEYLFVMTDPSASKIEAEVKFSDGINSNPFHCLSFSLSMMSKISGSTVFKSSLQAFGHVMPGFSFAYASAFVEY